MWEVKVSFVSLALERQSKMKKGAREEWRDTDRRRGKQRQRTEGEENGSPFTILKC